MGSVKPGAIGGDDGDVRSGIVRGEYRNADPHVGGIEVGMREAGGASSTVERRPFKSWVEGSIPSPPTNMREAAWWEHASRQLRPYGIANEAVLGAWGEDPVSPNAFASGSNPDLSHQFLVPVVREVWVGPTPQVVADPEPISLIATEEQIRAALERAGAEPEWVEPLVRIAHCESRFHTDARGDWSPALGKWMALGLWQSHWAPPDSGWAGWWAFAGEEVDADNRPLYWQDIDVAARVAVATRRHLGRFGGKYGWTCAGLLGIY